MNFKHKLTYSSISTAILLISIFAIGNSVRSHSGRTDSSGGHYNRKTGGYHYHNSGRSNSATTYRGSSATTSQRSSAIAKEVVIFEGVPEMKLQADGKKENPHALEKLSKAKASEYRCVITRKGGKYYWKSRENKELRRNESGIYITFNRTDGSPDYVRITNPTYSRTAATFGNYSYIEHLAHTLTTITYWGQTVRTDPAMTEAKVQQEHTVYITRTGSKYHRGNCRYLRQSKIPITLSSAMISYSACSVCNP
ncbi:MAG: YHYH domain-containing protein [Candidatus Poribacteria bacterium]|nr:YHYH domain-containing protein [Candidatus Poribacteria bacterium]